MSKPQRVPQQVRVNTWEQCERRLRQIERANRTSLDGVWFRGLPDARWGLSTTLERRSSRGSYVDDYFVLIHRIKAEIETFTGTRWRTPDPYGDLNLKTRKLRPSSPFEHLGKDDDLYDYIVHLRHHGFPSPLLDWSRSPYVAAYFAFAQQAAAQDVAIYAFSETPQNIKSDLKNGPRIISFDYYLRAHARHFRQQSSYTVCVERDNETEPWKFTGHEKIFNLQKKEQDTSFEQDILYKTIVPSSERVKVLKFLDRFNLNGFSLFGSQESLMDTLAFREIDFEIA